MGCLIIIQSITQMPEYSIAHYRDKCDYIHPDKSFNVFLFIKEVYKNEKEDNNKPYACEQKFKRNQWQ